MSTSTTSPTRFRLLGLALVAALVVALQAPASAGRSVNPVQLADAGWDCIEGPPFNPTIHCSPPGMLERIVAHTAVSGLWLTFDTDTVDATFLGSERVIRADRYNGQPCPTDPPSLTYSHMLERTGLDYYVCHTFDSPW